MVGSIRYVKQAPISSGGGWLDAEPEIQRLKPDIYAVNEDGDRGGKREYCERFGIEYLVLQRTPAPGLQQRAAPICAVFSSFLSPPNGKSRDEPRQQECQGSRFGDRPNAVRRGSRIAAHGGKSQRGVEDERPARPHDQGSSPAGRAVEFVRYIVPPSTAVGPP